MYVSMCIYAVIYTFIYINLGGTVYLSFSHHIPGNESVDLNFFKIIKKFNIKIIDIKEVIAPHMWSDRKVIIYIYELLKDIDTLA